MQALILSQQQDSWSSLFSSHPGKVKAESRLKVHD